jgi:hypothetical protein
MSELEITYTQRRKTQKPTQGQQVSRPRRESETSHIKADMLRTQE